MKEPIILVKTELGFERIVATRIKELIREVEAVPAPRGFKGLVLIYGDPSIRDRAVKEILKNIPEAGKVLPIHFVSRAEPYEICNVLSGEINKYISSNESFAVRTTRRGKHEFTSIDVNVIVGDCVRKYTGASVNLKYPDKIVFVEIIQNDAYISIVPGSFEYHKITPSKKLLYRIFRKISVVQMPFLGPIDSIKEMGKRIGREVQNFEVRELVVAPSGLVDGEQLAYFILSVLDGIKSRYIVQKKNYSRQVKRVPVNVMDIHQLVRDRINEVIIVFEPEGEYIGNVTDKLVELVLRSNKRVNLLFGSRQGIPLGIYRFADLVVDIAPGITLSTDYAAAAGLIALGTVLYDYINESDEG